MIERYVFVKLKPEHATEQGLREARERSAQLSRVPGVVGLTIGAPADAGARAAWDLCLVVRFETLSAVEPYLDHPEHEDYYQGFLIPRMQVCKAWNFEI